METYIYLNVFSKFAHFLYRLFPPVPGVRPLIGSRFFGGGRLGIPVAPTIDRRRDRFLRSQIIATKVVTCFVDRGGPGLDLDRVGGPGVDLDWVDLDPELLTSHTKVHRAHNSFSELSGVGRALRVNSGEGSAQ